MRLIHLIYEAVQNIRGNKGRSFLTLVGIVIGISSVITILTVGLAVQDYIDSQMAALGANLVMVMEGNFTNLSAAYQPVTRADMDAICDLPYAIDCSPWLLTVKTAMGKADKPLMVTVYGYGARVMDLAGNERVHGRSFTEAEVRDASPVILTYQPVAERLFPGVPNGAIGEKIRIDNVSYTVIGEYAEAGFGTAIAEANLYVIVPYTAYQLRMSSEDKNHLGRLMIFVDLDQVTIHEAKAGIEEILRSRHQLSSGDDSDFMITTSDEMLKMIDIVTTTFVIFLSGVAGISLIVAGIGIMNIMLVTVTERTKEIGLRKAVGARNADIMTQFLFESGFLSLMGGVIGIALGLAASFALENAFRVMGGGLEEILIHVRISVIMGTVLFAWLFGVVFGVVPARKAAGLEPVAALRSE